jgi:hypothetical protein
MTTAAFFVAGDSSRYPEYGLTPHHPERLYYSAFSNRWVRISMLMLLLKGKDPKRAGRNQDIDLSQIGVEPKKITTSIDYRRYWDVKKMASAKHGSQGGGTTFGRQFPQWLQKQLFGYESYILAYPPPPSDYREDDLFSASLAQIA